MAVGYTTKCVCTDLQEDASNSAEQLHSLLGLILDDGVVGLHSQNIVLSTTIKEKRGYKQTNKQTGGNGLATVEGNADVWRAQRKVR